MKKVIKLNIGGELKTGDVVGIAYNNAMTFGWFVEAGQYGSLKFLSFRGVKYVKDQYDDFIKGNKVNTWYQKRFSNGLEFKTFSKDYIIQFDQITNRAFKIPNPEEFFLDAGETEISYQEGRKLLHTLNFPAK
jgi:hypothetical protein